MVKAKFERRGKPPCTCRHSSRWGGSDRAVGTVSNPSTMLRWSLCSALVAVAALHASVRTPVLVAPAGPPFARESRDAQRRRAAPLRSLGRRLWRAAVAAAGARATNAANDDAAHGLLRQRVQKRGHGGGEARGWRAEEDGRGEGPRQAHAGPARPAAQGRRPSVPRAHLVRPAASRPRRAAPPERRPRRRFNCENGKCGTCERKVNGRKTRLCVTSVPQGGCAITKM